MAWNGSRGADKLSDGVSFAIPFAQGIEQLIWKEGCLRIYRADVSKFIAL